MPFFSFTRKSGLKFQVPAVRPTIQIKLTSCPATDHPWRNKFVGGKRALLRAKKIGLKRKAMHPLTAPGSEKIGKRRKDGVSVANGIFPSKSASPCHFY